jgi:hypothetical protein
MTTPCGPYSANRVAKVAKAVMSEHEWRWALRDRRTQEGVRIACSAPGCEWSAERQVHGPDLWDLHRAHVGMMIAATLAETGSDQ